MASTRSSEYRVGRNWIRAGDVVRVHGKRGLWRFVALVVSDSNPAPSAELVGPDHNPRTRTLPASLLRRVAQTEVIDGEVRTRRGIAHVRREQ